MRFRVSFDHHGGIDSPRVRILMMSESVERGKSKDAEFARFGDIGLTMSTEDSKALMRTLQEFHHKVKGPDA